MWARCVWKWCMGRVGDGGLTLCVRLNCQNIRGSIQDAPAPLQTPKSLVELESLFLNHGHVKLWGLPRVENNDKRSRRPDSETWLGGFGVMLK